MQTSNKSPLFLQSELEGVFLVEKTKLSGTWWVLALLPATLQICALLLAHGTGAVLGVLQAHEYDAGGAQATSGSLRRCLRNIGAPKKDLGRDAHAVRLATLSGEGELSRVKCAAVRVRLSEKL